MRLVVSENGLRFLDQSQSVVKLSHCNPTLRHLFDYFVPYLSFFLSRFHKLITLDLFQGRLGEYSSLAPVQLQISRNFSLCYCCRFCSLSHNNIKMIPFFTFKQTWEMKKWTDNEQGRYSIYRRTGLCDKLEKSGYLSIHPSLV